MTRTHSALSIAAAVVLAAGTISAGGWAVVTVDDLPARIEAAKPVTLAFTVRQHGMTPLGGLKPSIVAASGSSRVETNATAAQDIGQYSAAITLPSAGAWILTINSGFMDSRLSLLPVTVVSPGAAAPALSPVDQGQQLFVAKGCVTCHQNDASKSNMSTGVGPVLVAHKYQDDFLSRILTNPAATLPRRSDFVAMPNLNLKAPEVSALVAFINSR
jgi:mono/diheme cytochrome c family protein